jgi:hypothetical protein
VWFVGCRHIYIYKDNHLSNCSIIFITVAQYTQMYWNNQTALAEDNSEHSNSLNAVLKRNAELSHRAASEYSSRGLLVTNSLRRHFRSSYKPPIIPAAGAVLRHCVYNSVALDTSVWCVTSSLPAQNCCVWHNGGSSVYGHCLGNAVVASLAAWCADRCLATRDNIRNSAVARVYSAAGCVT